MPDHGRPMGTHALSRKDKVVRDRVQVSVARVVLIGLLIALTPLSYALAQTTACGVPGQMVSELDGWTRIRAPQFPTSPQKIVDYAVDPIAPERIFVTNGTSLARSTDEGCTWTEVLAMPPAGSNNVGTLSVSSIVISPAAHDTVLVVLREQLAGTTVMTRVVRSTDGGTTFFESEGLIPGSPVKLVVPESEPSRAYIATVPAAGTTAASTLLFVSHDAGASFELIPPIWAADRRPLPAFLDLAVDPLEPQQLWAAARNGLWRSDDSGEKWTPVQTIQLSNSMRMVDVFHEPGLPARIWAFGSAFNTDISYRSDDGGQTWSEIPALVGLDSIANGTGRDEVLAVSRSGNSSWAMSFEPSGPGWTPLKRESLPMRDVQADRSSTPSFYVGSDDLIWRSPRFVPTGGGGGLSPSPGQSGGPTFSPPPPPPSPSPPTGGNGCVRDAANAGSPPQADPPVLTPSEVELKLEVGESTTVPYELLLPPRATPVDLFFLMDASGSMDPALCGAANGSTEIATALLRAGVDAWFGVGSYQDWQGSCYSYRRDRNIAPLGPSFSSALRNITTCGGTEPQAESLYQSATGEGNVGIAAGQGATYRAGSLPIVVHIADEPLNTVPPPAHTLDEAITALAERGILQVGLSLAGGNNDGAAYPWMARVADGTGALATGPVDCDGDGDPEIYSRGDALVCPIPSSGGTNMAEAMAKAITDMVLAVRDDAPVILSPLGGGDVVAAVDPGLYPSVNLKQANDLSFGVTFSCGPEDAGRTVPVSLGAQVRDEIVATTAAVVQCGKTPVLALDVKKTNDADGDGVYNQSELAPSEGVDVPFRAEITNKGDTPLVLTNAIDEFSGTRIDVCTELLGMTIEPSETVECDFKLASYAPAPDMALENTMTVIGAQPMHPDRVALGLGLATVLTPRMPPPEAPPPPPLPPPPPPIGGFEVYNIPDLPPELPPTFELPSAPVANAQPNPVTNPQTTAQTTANPVTNVQTNGQTNQVTNVQNNPQTNSQSQNQMQTQTQVQAQAGLAAQRQVQPQAAMAAAFDSATRPDYGYAMSERRDPLGPARTTAALGGGGLLLAYGCLHLASRRQAAAARSETNMRNSSRRGER